MHDPTKFPNIYFSKKRAQHNFSSCRFNVFHRNTPTFMIFHLEFYIIVQCCFHPHFQQATQVYLQVAQVFVPQMFLMHLHQQLH